MGRWFGVRCDSDWRVLEEVEIVSGGYYFKTGISGFWVDSESIFRSGCQMVPYFDGKVSGRFWWIFFDVLDRDLSGVLPDHRIPVSRIQSDIRSGLRSEKLDLILDGS